MNAGTYRRRSGGVVTRQANGTIGRITADADCGCCGPPLDCIGINILPYVHLGISVPNTFRMCYAGLGPGQPFEGVTARGIPGNKIRRISCGRLYIWTGVQITSNALDAGMDMSAEANWVLKGTWGSDNAGGVGSGAGFRGSPYETTKGSGVLLDYAPYWWPSCGAAGYELTTPSQTVTIAQMDAARDTPLADGTYTYLVAFACISYLYRVGKAVAIPPSQGGLLFDAWGAIKTA